MTKETEWVNLTQAIQDDLINWYTFGVERWSVRCTNERTPLRPVDLVIVPPYLARPGEHPNRWMPGEPPYWAPTPENPYHQQVFNDAWAGRDGWALWVKGPLTVR